VSITGQMHCTGDLCSLALLPLVSIKYVQAYACEHDGLDRCTFTVDNMHTHVSAQRGSTCWCVVLCVQPGCLPLQQCVPTPASGLMTCTHRKMHCQTSRHGLPSGTGVMHTVVQGNRPPSAAGGISLGVLPALGMLLPAQLVVSIDPERTGRRKSTPEEMCVSPAAGCMLQSGGSALQGYAGTTA
jgi:hypothetical protein